MSAGEISWAERPVLVTGHTGFKGGWLSLWLHQLGARVHGYALNPPTDPSFFVVARVRSVLASDTRADLLDASALQSAFKTIQPEVVFHLAAQPLVREAYRNPLGTLLTNVIGTANVLEAARASESVRGVVVVTTDKVYDNREWVYPYREIDPLGGADPYSASKSAAELVVASYRASFFSQRTVSAARIATARAGNVIGGGDWAADRLVPDCLHAFEKEEPVRLRFPRAIRPWQHVLEPLAGYLQLAGYLLSADGQKAARPWNFGPDASGEATVARVAEMMASLWGSSARVEYAPLGDEPHEAGLLKLDSTSARNLLGWSPRWSLRQALERTVAWHAAWRKGVDMAVVTREEIHSYEAAGRS